MKTARLLLGLLAVLLLAGTATTTAQAESGYRFWGYYQWTGSQWVFAQKGPDGVVPADGSVEGWRYAVGGSKPRVPRAAGDFAAICATTPVESGKKRVAVVIDAGTPADSASGQTPPTPTGTCVVAAPTASGAKILAAVGPVRIEKSMVCGIGGYPETGCGQAVKTINVPATDAPVQLQLQPPVGSSVIPTATPGANSTSPAPAKQDNSGTPWGTIVAVVAILLLLGGGFFVSRRRRNG